MRSKWFAIGLLAVMAGCHSPRKGDAVAREFSGSDPDAQVSFWHQLTAKPVTSNDEAFHGLLLYADGKDDSADYSARVSAMKSRKMLPAGFDQAADTAVTRGTVAVALMQVIQNKGGITMHLLGPTPRYATRELMFLNVYPPSTANQTFSGNEFVGIIGRVEDYQRGNPSQVPAEVMPGELQNPPQVTKQQQPVRE
jgi:hypothetical protein